MKNWQRRINIISGTRIGGLKAAKTNKLLHGEDFYQKIGRQGGQNGNTGGFASNPELARLAGARGGRKSRRGCANKTQKLLAKNHDKIKEMLAQKQPVSKIAKETGVPASTLYRRIKEDLWD